MQHKIALQMERIQALKNRERNLYRSVFLQDTINFAEIGSVPITLENYGRYEDLVSRTAELLHILEYQIYQASVSLDDIELLALNKDAMAERVPAIWPFNRSALTRITDRYGPRFHPVHKRWQRHDGIDIGGIIGTPIVATGNGVVAQVTHSATGYGKQILIDHGFGYKTRYAHLSAIDVIKGQEVKRGEAIGKLGNSGTSTGPHLHYEVIRQGDPVDPESYFVLDMTSEEFQEILENARQSTMQLDFENYTEIN